MNIDNYLKLIVNHPEFSTILSEKDVKGFNGLTSTIKNHYFLTDGQALFYINLLTKNKDALVPILPIEFSADLEFPIWSKPFRQIEIIRKMYILNHFIFIESNYSNEIKNIMAKFNNTNYGILCISSGKTYRVIISEKAIVELVSKLKPLNFDISDELLNYYNIITSWNATDTLNKFNIANITSEETKQLIMSDIGMDTPIDSLIVNDRRIRYQFNNDGGYNTGLPNEQVSLSELIANRSTPKIWIDNTAYSLSDIIKTLIDLKRLPILFIFDNNTEQNTIDQLHRLSSALEDNNITDNIGIYFRLKNTDHGKPFNQFIADKKYNKLLDETTKIAGIEFANLPKFFLKTNWEPMTVLSFNNGFRSNKSSVYASRCDLNITYSAHKPFIEPKPF